MNDKKLKRRFYFIVSQLILITAFAVSAAAQTTVFTYQGKLTDAGNPAIGNYLLQFKLYDAISGGTQIGSTISNVAVTATNGVFTTQLDFGVSAFSGADRFLEIAVKKITGDLFTTLSPRQQITSSPYSIRTLSAAQSDVALDANKLGGIDASEYVTTTTVGSSFIRNATTQQTGNFNIDGNGFLDGNLGVGTTTPTSKLNVLTTGYGITQTGGAVTVGSFISTAGGGSGWFGTRSNHPLNFFTNDGLPQMTLLQNGNFGIGITNPTARLQVFSSVPGTTGIFAESPSGRAIWGKSAGSRGVYGESTSLEGVFGVSSSGSGVSGNSTSGIGVYGETNSTSLTTAGVYARNISGGRAIFAEGNVAQSLASNGLVKAMIYVQQNGTILRCYNSQTNSTTGNCGFTISHPATSVYDINFGFQIDNRFIATSPINNLTSGGCLGGDATLDLPVGNSIRIQTFCSVQADKPFMIFVY